MWQSGEHVKKISKRERKGKGKKEKTHKVAAAPHHAFVSEWECHREKRRTTPLASEREGAPYAPVIER